MSAVRAAAARIVRLFVDDARLAAAILVWIALAWGVLRPALPAPWACVAFAAGLGAILLESVRRARRA